MTTHKLHDDTQKLYGIACDPLKGIYHEIPTESNQWTETGQPVVVYAPTKQEAYDLLFSDWTEDENGNLDTYTPHPTTISVDYTEADGNQTAQEAMAIIEGLMVRPIKHPTLDEWAMFVSPQLLARATAGPAKDALIDKHVDKVNAGKNKTKAEALAGGW